MKINGIGIVGRSTYRGCSVSILFGFRCEAEEP